MIRPYFMGLLANAIFSYTLLSPQYSCILVWHNKILIRYDEHILLGF